MTDWIEPERSARRLLRRGAGAERVSDADRDHAVTLLREHVVVGRLTLDEFSERVGVALRARTRDDIAGAMSDLPVLAVAAEEGTRRRARRWFVAVMSRSQAKGRWRLRGRTTAVAVMGGCDMDLRHAEIDGTEVVITALAFWGGIHIVVPEGFDVDLVGLSLMGSRDLIIRNVPRVPGSPRIRVRGFAVMGGIDVKSKPSRTGREIGQSIIDRVLGTVSALPGRPGAAMGTPGAAPIDLETLGRDIKEQFRARRDANRTASRGERATGRRPTLDPGPLSRGGQRPPAGERTGHQGGDGHHPLQRHGGLCRHDRASGRPAVARGPACAPPDRPPVAGHVRWPRNTGPRRRIHGCLRRSRPCAALCGQHAANVRGVQPDASGPSHPGPHRDPYR